MHFRAIFNAMETQQMFQFTVLSSHKIVLTAVQNTKVLMFSCKVPQMFVRKLKICCFVENFPKIL